MVLDSQKSGLFDVKNTENNPDYSRRRRRIMNFKLSFRKKKKSRYDCEFMSSNNSNCDGQNQDFMVGNKEQKTVANVGKDEKPRGIINKIFSFRKSRRKSSNGYVNGDLSPNVRTKSLDFLADPITDDKKQNGMVSSDLGHQTTELGLNRQGLKQTDDIKRGKTSPRFSLSSPNLACVEWTSFDSVGSEQDDENKTRKRGSLRRSRASLVFPVSEIGSSVFNQLKHTVSEKNLPRRPNTNKTLHSKSCLPLDSSTNDMYPSEDNDIIFTVNKDILKSSLNYRTPDGRSPHPGKRSTICSAAFSLPEIFEDENKLKKVLSIDGSTNHLIKNKENTNISTETNKKRQESISYSQYSILSDSNIELTEEKGEDNFSGFKKLSTGVLKKPLGRYISCPGIGESSLIFDVNQEEPNFIAVDSVKLRKPPYSPHIRPYSLHEGMMAPNNFKTYAKKQAFSVGDYETSIDETLPPDDELNLPSKDLPLAFAEALWDHTSDLKTEMNFRAGEMIAVYFMNNQNWWWGTKDERKGWFPSSHVRLLVDQNLDDGDDEMETIKGKAPIHRMPLLRHNTLSLLGLQDNVRNQNDLRSRCVQELLTSERDYVKTLRDVSEGYLKQARKKPDMFKPDDIVVVFSNIEQIYQFHKRFYREMQKRIDQIEMHKSHVGELFVYHGSEFDIYSEYCNNHPSACARLLELQKEKRYRLFFESCRLLQQMISLSIDSFLLTPVQKICKYPLQLNELLKHTPSDHADHEPLQAAVQVMRDVASSINERKRKFENLTSLAEWQLNIDSWQGNDLLEDSSELIKRGIIERLNGIKLEEIHLSLFDHQLVICRKESYKKNSKMYYVERVNLDCATFESISDVSGQNIQYMIKIKENEESKAHCFITRSTEERDKWIKALTKEKQIVKNEKRIGCAIPKTVRLAAMESAKTKKNSECKKEHRRRKSLTDPFQGLEFGANVIRRSFRLRRTQSLREKKSAKGQ